MSIASSLWRKYYTRKYNYDNMIEVCFALAKEHYSTVKNNVFIFEDGSKLKLRVGV